MTRDYFMSVYFKKINLFVFSSILLFALSFSSVQQVLAEDADKVKSADVLLKAFFKNTNNLTANFTQITLDENGQQIEDQAAAGLFILQRPGKFRWHAVSPSELVLLADGKNFWNYDVELEQVIVKPIDETLSNTPAMLLSGESDVLKAFTLGSSFATTLDIGNVHWIQLTPKDKNSDFSRLSIGFLDETIRLMELATNVGQVIRVELTDVQTNSDIKDSVFKFEIPADVDVIGEAL